MPYRNVESLTDKDNNGLMIWNKMGYYELALHRFSKNPNSVEWVDMGMDNDYDDGCEVIAVAVIEHDA